VGSSEVSETFFAVVKRIYSFFSASTHRWEVLLKDVPNVVKRVTGTRWSAHYEAVKALQQYFIDVVGALNKLCNQNENIDTRGQAILLVVAFPAVCILTMRNSSVRACSFY